MGGLLGYEYVTSVNHPTTSWIDEDAVTNIGTRTLYYYITAVDNTQKESAFSNEVSIWAKLPKLVNTDEVQEIQKFELLSNFPNPFNPMTTFEFVLPENSPVRLTIFDISGRQVTELINETLSSGKYTIQYDASFLASGVYLYRLSAGEFFQTRKMMLVK